ncbi:hypothetical protein HII17_07280 [Thalassotalea sp. M1531]|uniref:Uncharacterized protein n=1 Tax=Thalassotalea algicola TaxID=2716224 RepID=A0A7Y0LBA1_9GAMM|nr:hypothetical protein [Thalassotalea algicola]NMP31359.1 hypothetical protein [Thalassotalea algicola]
MKVNLPSTIAALALLQLASANAQTTDAIDDNQAAPTTEQAQKVDAVEPLAEELQEQEAVAEDAYQEIDIAPQETELGIDNVESVEEVVEDVIEETTESLDDESLEETIAPVEEEALEEQSIDELAESEPVLVDEISDEEYSEEATKLEDTLSDLSGEEALGNDDEFNPNAYNFERPIPQEGDVYIPVLDDAKVFAEFIDSMPAVVNFYTYATEDDVIAFYTENYGEPVEQERKRGRLTVIYYLEDIATRVVISEQDDYRQVDVLQESAGL